MKLHKLVISRKDVRVGLSIDSHVLSVCLGTQAIPKVYAFMIQNNAIKLAKGFARFHIACLKKRSQDKHLY